MDYSKLRGFNYQPSYGSNGLDIWRHFDADIIALELGRGRQYFPHMNAIRLWLSWEAFEYGSVAERDRFCANFDRALAIADEHQMKVMPVLFNRWHNDHLDYGGIYIDHLLPLTWGGTWCENLFTQRCCTYLEAVVRPHLNDPRVLAWDLCNEPFSYNEIHNPHIQELIATEYSWLEALYHCCKELGTQAPITIGAHWGTPIEKLEPISDILSVHPYWTDETDQQLYERHLDNDLAFAKKVSKPLIATEACWGHLDDMKRVELIRYSLSQLAKRDIGWLVYLLHHSLIADAHRPEFGRVGKPGNLAFIESDGTLRQGHDIFNNF